MKRLLLALVLIALILVPKSYAYWEASFQPESVEITKEISIYNFQYGTPPISGLIEYTYDNKQYKNNDLIHMNGRYFVVVNEQACSYMKPCPDPTTFTTPYEYNPYREISLEYSKTIYYAKDDVAMKDGMLYKPVDLGTALKTDPSVKGLRGWRPLDASKLHLGYLTNAGSYFIYQGEIIHLNVTISQVETSYDATKPNYNPPTRYKHEYDSSIHYKVGQAAFYQGGAYVVMNAELANQSAPGSLYGAWNRIDTNEWQPSNVYKAKDAVTHKGKVYQAIANGVTGEPGASLNTWNAVQDINFNQYNIYPAYTPVIHNNAVYHSLVETSNVTPGSPGSESVWKKH